VAARVERTGLAFVVFAHIHSVVVDYRFKICDVSQQAQPAVTPMGKSSTMYRLPNYFVWAQTIMRQRIVPWLVVCWW
jgi:hypothetical protein